MSIDINSKIEYYIRKGGEKMSKIDFSKLAEILSSSTNFSLTEKQYEKLTGRKMPNDTTYLLHRSALARFADSLGLKIQVQEKVITFEKNI